MRRRTAFLMLVFAAVCAQLGASLAQQATPALDYEFFETQVQPIFLATRPGHTRCVSCHTEATRNPRLQPLAPGATSWNEEQSRQNFEVIQRLVVPGSLRTSRLLLMPLRWEAGGTPFHRGGKHWDSVNDPEWQVLAAWVRGEKGDQPITPIARPSGRGVSSSASTRSFRPNPGDVRLEAPTAVSASQGPKLRIIQTNGAGDNLHIIDPVTDTVVAEITGIEVGHGVVVAPDSSRLYVSNEADHTLDVVDARSLTVTKKIGPLTARPNNIAVTVDGRKVYVAINSAPGGVDVIDTTSLTIANHIPLNDVTIHNPFVTPDGKYVVAGSGSSQTPMAFVIDTRTDEPVWSISFDASVRPLAFHTNPDGSTKWMLVNLAGFNGFVVVDFATHQQIARIENPYAGGDLRATIFSASNRVPSHGIWVAPDQQSVWVSNRWDNAVYAYSLPDLQLLGYVPVGADPMWATFTPDSKKLYVANNAAGSVSVVDTTAMKELTRIEVGQGPRRNHTAMLP